MTSAFSNTNGKICIIPIGNIDRSILEDLAKGIRDSFGKEVEIAPAQPLPQKAYNKNRHQYYSTFILNEMKNWSVVKKLNYERILGIVDVDLYVPSLNFVFGEADMQSGIAIISLIRLRQDFYGLPEDDKLFRLRSLKEAVHELGHTYGLFHCSNSNCVMYFSNSLIDTDKKDFRFCSNCSMKLL